MRQQFLSIQSFVSSCVSFLQCADIDKIVDAFAAISIESATPVKFTITGCNEMQLTKYSFMLHCFVLIRTLCTCYGYIEHQYKLILALINTQLTINKCFSLQCMWCNRDSR